MDALEGEPVATMSGSASAGKPCRESRPLESRSPERIACSQLPGRRCSGRHRQCSISAVAGASRFPPPRHSGPTRPPCGGLGPARIGAHFDAPFLQSPLPHLPLFVPGDAFPALLSTGAHVFRDSKINLSDSRAASEPIEPAPIEPDLPQLEPSSTDCRLQVDTSRWLRRGASVQVLLCCSMYLTAS